MVEEWAKELAIALSATSDLDIHVPTVAKTIQEENLRTLPEVWEFFLEKPKGDTDDRS